MTSNQRWERTRGHRNRASTEIEVRHTVVASGNYWMDAKTPAAIILGSMMPPRRPLTVVKLSDHFGQYVLTIICPCSHTRIAQPQTLARVAGWNATLVAVVKRMRCSKCGARGQGSAAARRETKRDG